MKNVLDGKPFWGVCRHGKRFDTILNVYATNFFFALLSVLPIMPLSKDQWMYAPPQEGGVVVDER
jgi:hypothetical protein